MREKGVVATRQLAKRQLTWLRKIDDLNWFDCTQAEDKLLTTVQQFLEAQ